MLLEAGIFKGNTELSVSFQVPSLVPQASPADQTGATAGAGDKGTLKSVLQWHKGPLLSLLILINEYTLDKYKYTLTVP